MTQQRGDWNPYGELSDLQLMEVYDKEFPNLWPLIMLLIVLWAGWRYTGWFFWISLTILLVLTALVLAAEPTSKRHELRKEIQRRMNQ